MTFRSRPARSVGGILIPSFLALSLGAPNLLGQFWQQTTAPITSWSSIASSADGSKLVAAVKGGPIYTSTNSGATWIATSAPNTNWSAVASSADGTKLIAAVAVFWGNQYESGGPIYVSADSGDAWKATDAPITNWSSVASSADGSKLVAVAGGTVAYVSSAPSGPIYISSDSGATWTLTSVSAANCVSVASSADGSKLVAGAYQGPFVFSRDSGSTWETIPTTFAYFLSIASSADGRKLLAGNYDPFHPPGTGGGSLVLTSTNSGGTWDYVYGAASRGRGLVACSADGTVLIKAGGRDGFGNGGPILISADSGVTWTENNAPIALWSSVTSSADGRKLAAAADGGGIWTIQSRPMPSLSVAREGGTLAVSWIVPSMDFVLQEHTDLATTGWKDVTQSMALNFTNLKLEVTLPISPGKRLYRLKH